MFFVKKSGLNFKQTLADPFFEPQFGERTPMADPLSTPPSGTTDKDLILVAEDSPPNRKILVHLLEKLGYQVEGYADGAATWEALTTGKLPKAPAAILSDIMMPGMDGLQLLKNLRESDQFKQIPFVLITAVSDKNYIVEAKSLKVDGYILKPVTFNKVTLKLQELFPAKKFPKLAG